MLEFQDPEPFSDAEDQAVGAGLRGMRINAEGETGYFGLVASNATDNQETIAFFSPDRESFVEYDITKLIHSLSNPKKRVVGLMTALPLDGGKMPMGSEQPTPPWLIMDQIREFFDGRDHRADGDRDPVARRRAARRAAHRAHASRRLRDRPVRAQGRQGAGVHRSPWPRPPTSSSCSSKAKAEPSWPRCSNPGASISIQRRWRPTSQHARRVQFGGRGGDAAITEYVAWLALDRSAIDEGDVLSSGIDVINVGSSGFFTKADGASTQVTPILHTSTDAMEVPVQKVGRRPIRWRCCATISPAESR